MRFIPFLLVLFTMACTMETPKPTASAPVAAKPVQVSAPAGPRLSSKQAARNFISVVERMEPVVERACREMAKGMNCDFKIVIDDRPGQAPNAFQTLQANGRPVLGFTVPLLLDVRNKDELAFILGHESAHHIRRHLARQQSNAQGGAFALGILAAALGGSVQSIDAAQQIGASVGARSYSKKFELEADSLGAVLTKRAGYDPVRGAAYFTRIPDPGNKFLGTHPPNTSRIQTVRAAVGQ